MVDKALDLGAGGLFQGFRAAEVDGIGLDQIGIELVLADELAEAIADTRTAVSVGPTIAV